MAPEHANARAGDPGEADAIGKISTAEDSATTATVNWQAITLPSLADARARLVELIRQKPEPKPEPKVETDAQACARHARAGRRADAQRTLALIAPRVDRPLAWALKVSPRTISRWRGGKHAPTPAHWRQLLGVKAVLVWGGRP